MNQEQDRRLNKEQAGQKAAHTAGKIASNYFAPGIGGKAYDILNKSKANQALGQKLGKNLNQNPAIPRGTQEFDDSADLNETDNSLSSSGSNGLPNDDSLPQKDSLDSNDGISKNEGLGDSNQQGGLLGGLSSLTGDSDNSQQSDSLDGNGSFLGDISLPFGKKKGFGKKIFISLAPVIFQFMVIIVAVAAIIGPFMVAIEFVLGIWEKFVDFFTVDKQELEEKYYAKLDEVYEEYKSEGIYIDINMITAALTVNRSFDEMLEDAAMDDEEDSDDSEEKKELRRMKRQVDLLANMQIRYDLYGLDEGLKDETGYYCSNNEETIVVDSNNVDDFDIPDESDNPRDSSTPELIALNDADYGIFDFFVREATEEENKAYYIYHPKFDSDGSCSDEYAKEALLESKKVVDIGDYASKEDHVFYWNLVNSFIPSYYDEFVSDSEPERTKDIKKIASDIYLLYGQVASSISKNNSSLGNCRVDEGPDFYSGENFINNIAPIAIDEMTRTGVLASVTLSQAILESGSGGSTLSTKYANYYGMTAGSCAPDEDPALYKNTVLQSGESGNECTGNYFWSGAVVAMCNSSGVDCQWYRVYDSFLNSTRDHSRLLATSMYGCNVLNSFDEQVKCVAETGYATDPNYANKLFNLNSNHNLVQYDIGNWDGTIADFGSNQYDSFTCSYDGHLTGDFLYWKQYDARWKNVSLGPSTVGAIGCAVTSTAIQIMRSGVSTSLGDNFDPGTFVKELTKINGFTAGGGIYWYKPPEIAPNFKFVNAIRRYAPPSEIEELVSKGYYVILNVKNGGHWVAVDRVEGDKIYMFDPGYEGNEVGATHGLNSIVGYVYYMKG